MLTNTCRVSVAESIWVYGPNRNAYFVQTATTPTLLAYSADLITRTFSKEKNDNV